MFLASLFIIPFVFSSKIFHLKCSVEKELPLQFNNEVFDPDYISHKNFTTTCYDNSINYFGNYSQNNILLCPNVQVKNKIYPYITLNITDEIKESWLLNDIYIQTRCHHELKERYIFIYGNSVYPIQYINQWVYVREPHIFCAYVKVENNFIYCYPYDFLLEVIRFIYDIERDNKLIDEQFKEMTKWFLDFGFL